MNVLINHCWCSDSIWGGQYNCRVIVTIDMIPEGKSYHDDHEPDWLNLIEDDIEFDSKKPFRTGRYETCRLKPEVMQWLNDNIKDVGPEESDYNKHSKKGWAVGSDEYNSNSGISFSLFFQRRNDAMKFIKHWSSHKNPVSYLNYFKDIRRELDPTTGKMKRVPR